MKTRNIFLWILSKVFKKAIARRRAERAAQRAAMQAMTHACSVMRDHDCSVKKMNEQLEYSLKYYKRGDYRKAIEWAERLYKIVYTC